MVREVKKGKSEANKVQILLFSATFADEVKAFAQSVIGEQANEVSISFIWRVKLNKRRRGYQISKGCQVSTSRRPPQLCHLLFALWTCVNSPICLRSAACDALQ